MAKILLFGYGNPGRGDDALGPLLVERFRRPQRAHVRVQTDMQLLIEHVTDLQGCGQVVFADADVGCAEPFHFSAIQAQQDDSYTSHALTPAALLHVYRQVYQCDAPAAFLLRIRGYNFALGDSLSDRAADNLNAAVRFINQRVMQS
ncbi:MAG: hydrogenase maturation protease [Burkholderiales bacterium]|nr:hydrogenase maturation protease [Burkholderiales bacterium]